MKDAYDGEKTESKHSCHYEENRKNSTWFSFMFYLR